MNSQTQLSTDRSDYFYDMLEQLLVIGRAAGGDALVDATLIGGLLATRQQAQAEDQASNAA